ncbi:MAG TPA: DUF4388 domain-containing protein [Candidatus Binatia bacterium]|nr:DUF4388 domain-containing protein [Candidatus Binatia bacterium]
MQTQGSLQESSLASLLQTMQTERATGALSLESDNDSANLYFLFGHLFHAQGPAGQGEDLVINALSWQDGRFRFDPRAKLPPEETIKASASELIAEAERRAPAAEAAQAEPWEGEPAYGEGEVTPFEAGSYPEAPASGYPESAWEAPLPQQEAGPGPMVAPEAASTYSAWASPSPAAATGRSAYEAPPGYPAPDLSQGSAPPAYPQQMPEAPVEPAPTAPQAVLGAPGAVPLEIVYPLPSGKVQYEGLKSAFVDFPKLLRTLRGDRHTGYVRLAGPDFAAVLVFRDGHLLEALSSEPGAQSGEPAFRAVQRSMEAGTSTLDVVDLPGETVDALAQLLTAPLLYTGLLGRFVQFDALLAHLSEEGIEGAVIVVCDEDTGIILFSQGHVLGAYTQSNPTLTNATTAVAKIAGEKGSRIEVKSGGGAVTGIDVERALSRAF